MRDYIKTHLQVHKVKPQASLVVEKVEFITNKEAKARLNTMTDPRLPENSLLCYVELSGNFQFSGPPGVQLPTINKIVELFDAETGNLFQIGPAPTKS